MATETTRAERVLAGRYRLGRVLGRGGMARVYEALDERLGRRVAVKMLRADLAGRPDVRDRFAAEARAAARLSHPNVVSVYDTGEDGGSPFLVMELLPGTTLADLVAEEPLEVDWVRRTAGDVLQALAAAHAAGVVHRDVKPGNILIGDDGCAKVADFGIAKTAETAAHGDVTATGELLGTPAYLAPERMDGRPATPASDLYSLGVVLYEALAGHKPPLDGPVPPLASVRPDVEPGLAAVVEKAMARDPGRRFADAAEMLEALHGDDTRVLGVVGDSGAADAAGATGAAGADATRRIALPPPLPQASASAWRLPSGMSVAVLVVGVMLLLAGLALALTKGRDAATGEGAAESALVEDLRSLAERVRVGDGPAGPELGQRLEEVASQVEAGGGSTAANELLVAVAEWHRTGQLYDTAAREATEALLRVPGAQPPTTVAPTTVPPPADRDDGGDDDERGKGKGKGKDD